MRSCILGINQGLHHEISLNKINTFLETLEEKGVQIIEKNVKIDTSDNMWVIDAGLLVRELVGSSVTIEPEADSVSEAGEDINE